MDHETAVSAFFPLLAAFENFPKQSASFPPKMEVYSEPTRRPNGEGSFVAASSVALCLLPVEKDFACSFRDENPSRKQTLPHFVLLSPHSGGCFVLLVTYWDEVLGLPAVAGGCHS